MFFLNSIEIVKYNVLKRCLSFFWAYRASQLVITSANKLRLLFQQVRYILCNFPFLASCFRMAEINGKLEGHLLKAHSILT